MSGGEEKLSGMESKEKTGPTSDSRGSHGHQQSLSFREGISESANNFTLTYDESGSLFCKHHNKARSYSYPVSSSSSPPWSPLCSPAPPKSEAAIPFAWEDKPGVPKQPKAPTMRSCFGGALPPPPPSASKFSIRRLKTKVEEADPFASALVECTKQTAAAAVSMLKGGAPSRRSKQGNGLTYLLHEFLRRHRRHSVLSSGCCKTIAAAEQREQPLEKIAEIPSKVEVC